MLKKNDEVILTIENYGYEGEGIARYEGVAVFVPFAAKGDRVKVRIVKTASSHMFGKVVEFLEKSAEHCQAPCPVYGKCGGCSIMHLPYETQLEFKRERVEDCMRKIGGLNVQVLPTIGSEKQLGYRNKVQLPVGTDSHGEVVCGFFAPRSHRIVPMEGCMLQSPYMNRLTEAFMAWMRSEKIQPYCEETGKGLVRHLFIRCSWEENPQTVVMPVINGDKLPGADKLEKIMKNLGVTTLVININKKKSNVILGDSTQIIYGDGVISDTLCGNVFEISPMSFYQVNHSQAEKLYELAIENAGITKEDVVYDLYCGAGTITLCAAKKAKKVYGIEIVPQAVENAKENARRNNIKNAEFFCGDVAKITSQLKVEEPPRVVILDPPRKGCDREMLELLVQLNPEKIAYISCNPATLARDMAYLSEKGYTPGAVQPVDLFPQTGHIESAVILSC